MVNFARAGEGGKKGEGEGEIFKKVVVWWSVVWWLVVGCYWLLLVIGCWLS